MVLFLLILVLAVLFVLALMPSMRPYRAKLLGVVSGAPSVLLLILISAPFLIIALLAALPVSSLVIYLWLKREGEQSPTYWQCLTFSLLFGILFFVVSLMLRDTLLAFVNVSH